MNSGRFTRTKEDFNCAKCGTQVVGDGYTDHCPNCLWSKHVDINPGDRAATCQALMEPVGVQIRSRERSIVYRCVGCGILRRCKAKKEDNFEELLRVAAIGNR